MGISMNEESYSIISLIAMNRIRLSLQYQTFVDSGIRRICIYIYSGKPGKFRQKVKSFFLFLITTLLFPVGAIPHYSDHWIFLLEDV